MKKFLSGLVGLILVLVAAALVVPGMIDWNDYKEEIAAQVKAVTGRDLSIDGDIRITVLPAPALVATDVRLANIDGASVPDMVSLRLLEIRIALGPLFGGSIQVETIKLIEPVIELEVLADGRRNWDFAAAEEPPGEAAAGDQAAAPAATAETGGGGPGPDVRLDDFVIEYGTLIYRDQRDGTIEQMEVTKARIAAASLSGPFESSGKIVARGIPLDYDISVGQIIHGRTVPFSLTLGDASGGTTVQVSGALLNLAEAPRFKGTVTGKGKRLASLLQTAGGAATLPGFLAQEFSFKGSVVASAAGAAIDDLVLALGDARATGSMTVEPGETTNIAVEIAVNRIDLDRWLSMPPAGIEPAADEPPEAADGGDQPRASVELPPPGKPAVADLGDAPPTGFAIPVGINASARVSVDSVIFSGGIVRQVRASAELAGGEITISQLAAQFPGGSDVAVFGFVTAEDGQPRFDGEVETSVSDFRGVLRWLDLDIPDIPAERLRKLTLTGRIAATPVRLEVSGLDLQFDSSRVTGGVTVAMRRRLSFGADLTLDRINLDAYLPRDSAASATPAGLSAAQQGPVPAADPAVAATPAATGKGAPLAVLGMLGTFDANLRTHIKTLVYQGTSIKDIVFDGTLFANALKVRRASVAKLAGASAKLSGTIEGLDGVPSLKDVRFEATAKDLSRLFRLAGIEPPVPPRKLGTVVLGVDAGGPLVKPTLDLELKAAGARVEAAGTVTLLPLVGGADLKVRVRHNDLARLLRALGADYRPAGRLGGLDVAATLRGDAVSPRLEGITGKIGPIDVDGRVTLRLDGPRPRIDADLTTGEIVVDVLLPAERTSSIDESPFGRFPGAVLVPVAWPVPAPVAARPAVHRIATRIVDERWSRVPIDLSGLRAFDGSLKLKAAAIAYRNYRIETVDLAATLNDGVLRADRLVGDLFGGALRGNAVVVAAAPTRIEAELILKGVDANRALKAMAGRDLATGRVGLDLKLATVGDSPAEMISALGGGGSLSIGRLKVKAGARGSPLAGVLALAVGLDKLGGALGGGQAGQGMADITGTFTVDRGVARSTDLRMVSGIGDARAGGVVDLAKWSIDVSGEVNLANNILTRLLTQATETPTVLPFAIKGRLDAPTVKLDTAKLLGKGVPIPGLDKILGKSGIGGLLQQIVPGLTGGQAGTQPPPPPSSGTPPPPPPTTKKIKPEDLLKQLFKIQ